MFRVISHVRSNVVAYLALFVALGGTSYAAIRLPVNSVGTPQLKASAVTSPKVKDGSLLATDFKAGQLAAGTKGDAGATGPGGPAGPAGPAGATGAGGAQGEQGVQGTAGSGGASFVAQAFGAAGTQQPVPQMPDGVNVASTTLDLPTAGRLYVYAHGQMANFCSNSGDVRLLLHLDGKGLAGTARFAPYGTGLLPGTSLAPSGVTASVTAGSHTLALFAKCTTGGSVPNGMSPSGEYQVGALLLAG